MSAKITIEEAQARLAELIAHMVPGEEVVITRNEQPVAKLIAERTAARLPRQPGSAKGKLIIHSEDEQHLEDFKEYSHVKRTTQRVERAACLAYAG